MFKKRNLFPAGSYLHEMFLPANMTPEGKAKKKGDNLAPDSSAWRGPQPEGRWEVIVSGELPASHWLEILLATGCGVQVCDSEGTLPDEETRQAIGIGIEGYKVCDQK